MIYKYEKFQSSCKTDKLPKHSNNRNNRNNITINSPYIYSSNNDKDKIIKLQGSGLDSNNIPFGTSDELYAEKLGMLIGQGAAHNYEIIGINEACKIKNEDECSNANAIGCLWDSIKNHCGLSKDLKIKGQCGLCKTHPECIKKGEDKNIPFNVFCDNVTGSVIEYPDEQSSYESQYSTLVETCNNFCKASTFN